MKRIIQFIKSHPEKVIVLLFFFAALFLRTYKLPEYATFLGDQGRDAIVIKDIVTLKHFTAIGPVSSIGGVFLGPFFYYFMAPWLILFLLNPVGLAFGTAIINSFGVIMAYCLLSRIFNRQIGLIASILYSFSYTLIEFSRFSWNPNILPLFIFIYIYLFLKLVNTVVSKDKPKKLSFPRKWESILIWIPAFARMTKRLTSSFLPLRWINTMTTFLPLFTGMFFAFCMQLHYSVVFLGAASILVWGYYLIKGLIHTKNYQYIRTGLISLIGFIIGYIPLILFDLRHGFLNTNNLVKMFSEEKTLMAPFSERIVSSFGYALTFLSGIPVNGTVGIIITLALIVFVLYKSKVKRDIFVLTVLFLGSLIGTTWFMDARIPHYYNVIYPFIIVLFAYLLFAIWNIRAIGRISVILLLGLFIVINVSNANFFIHQGSNQINRAEKVARIIYNDVPSNTSFTLTTLPHRYDDYSYRYFLEKWNKYPTSKEVREQADLLYVACPEKCTPIGDPGWDVAFFAPNKIDNQWKVDHVTIYRLSR
jgi:hypothetical protein